MTYGLGNLNNSYGPPIPPSVDQHLLRQQVPYNSQINDDHHRNFTNIDGEVLTSLQSGSSDN